MIWGQNFKFLLSLFIVKLDLEMTFGNVVECLQGHLISVFDGGYLRRLQWNLDITKSSGLLNERFRLPQK